MDCFVPSQFTNIGLFHRNHYQATNLATSWKDRLTSWAARSSYRGQSSSELAFAALGLLNIPAILKYHHIEAECRQQVAASWEKWASQSFTGSLLSPWLEGIAIHRIATESTSLTRQARQEFMRRYALTSDSTRPAWTWITHSFVHIEVQHLVSNMIGPFTVAGPCAKIPSMNLFHVLAIAIGASVSGSAATVYWHGYHVPSQYSLVHKTHQSYGASAIVSAFVALAGVAVPETQTVFGVLCWQSALLAGISDLAGLLRLAERFQSYLRDADVQPLPGIPFIDFFRTTTQTNHASHLAGAAFGVIYYYLVLRRNPTDRRHQPDHRH